MNALPKVAVNFAITWDGRVSTRKRTRADFSSPQDKHRLLEIRAGGDALLVGGATLETDAMRMGLPDEALRASRVRRGMPPYPIRVIASNSGRIDPAWPVFSLDVSPILIFSTRRMPPATQAALKKKAALHLAGSREVDLREMLATLRRDYAVRRVICEGGPRLFRSLLERDLVDELNVTYCPRIFGGAGAPTLTGCAGNFLSSTRECRLQRMKVIGEECFATYRLKRDQKD